MNSQGPQYRLRQVALVTHDLDRTVGRFAAVFGLAVGRHDPLMRMYGLHNAVLPAGGDFIEVVGMLDGESSAKRYVNRRGGDAGYMLILQTDDAIGHRKRLADKGVLGIEYSGGEPYGSTRPAVDDPELKAQWERFGEIHHSTHFHPRDTAGVLTSIDSVKGIHDWRRRDADWPAAGPQWRKAQTDFCKGVVGVSVQHRDPEAAAKAWSSLLELPVSSAAGAPAIALFDSIVKFVPPRDADGTGFVGLDLAVADPQVARDRARAAGVLSSNGDIMIGGLAVTPVGSGG